MQLDALLRSHGFMRVERPPQLWEADARITTLVPLLGEMIAARLALGGRLEDLTLNASNVVVGEDDFGDDRNASPAPGEYVALTVLGEGAPEDDGIWTPARAAPAGALSRFADRLAAAGVRFAYTRSFDGKGTITVFLARKA